MEAGKAALLAAGVGVWVAGREVIGRMREVDLRGRVALVTGGSRGLGLLIARELADEGCRLALCARDAEELERAREDLQQRGAEVLTVPCDVSDREQVDALIRRVTGHYGGIDVLVNNAGIIQSGPMQDMTVEDYEQALGVMFWGTVYSTLAALPGLRARGAGRIVNVTSIGGKIAVPHLSPYCSAKFAAVGFSEGLRAELARDGITVTTVVPGLMRTGSPLNAYFKGQQQAEFPLFAVLDTLPVMSMDARKAARLIVRALKRGQAEVTFTLPAMLGARFHGLFPGLTADLLGLVNRALPGPRGGEGRRNIRGMDLYQPGESPLLDRAIGWSLAAARRNNEYPGPLRAEASTRP